MEHQIARIHCTNYGCLRRDDCAKGGDMRDGDRAVYFHSPANYNCPEFECNHRVIRHSTAHYYKCDQCPTTFDNPTIKG